MYKGKRIAGIVPARGGSKGIKNKNIKLLSGKPLIGYTLDCIVSSNVFDFFAVSTDSLLIEDEIKKWNPYIIHRPSELASDNALGRDVINHSINFIKEEIGFFDYCFYLQPTSPLRNSSDIINALDLALEKKAKFVVSICECEHSPLLCNKLPSDLALDGFLKNTIGNRQNLEKYYRVNGAIYLIRNDSIDLDFFGKESYAYIMPKERSVDIDEEIDFTFAEVLINERNIRQKNS